MKKLIIGKVKFVKGFPTQIFDSENNHIADVETRSWGRLQYMEEGDKLHHQLSQFICDAINEKLESDYILKQKVRDLINELDTRIDNATMFERYQLNSKIELLKELLK